MTRSPNTEINFFRLTGLELLLAGAWTLFTALSQSLRTTTLLAVAVMLAGFVTLAAPFFLKSYIAKLVSVLGGRLSQLAAVAVPVVLAAFLFLRTPSIDALKIIGSILVCIWLIGIEVLFFFQKPREATQEQNTAGYLSVLSILLGYGILLIPSRVPSLLDGFPWNTPLEFITATLILPFAFFFGRSFLSKKTVTVLFALLLVAKLTLSFILPQSGLGVQIYTSAEAFNSGKWSRTYDSFQDSNYSEIMQLPYRSFYDFPIEYINSHGYKREAFWLTLQFSGVISLQEDERLVVLVRGANDRQIELIDLETGTSTNLTIAKSMEDINYDLFKDIPYVNHVELKGTILFRSYGNAYFEPVILNSKGAVRSALSVMSLTPSDLDLPLYPFQLIQLGISLLFLGLLAFGIFDGWHKLFKLAKIDGVDVYLGLTGFILFYTVNIIDRSIAHLLILVCVILMFGLKFLDLFVRHKKYSAMGYLFSIGIPILLMFLPLDLTEVQSVVQIPQYQDAMEYQVLARNIYVSGDLFLQKTPPWSYKVLYPYIIGLVHILFGQSMSAQLYLNAWCAVLSVMLMVKIAQFFGVKPYLAYLTSAMFFILLALPISFVYYFRFGLIEPLAILTLLAAGYFAIRQKVVALFFWGVLTGMLRLNFGGSIFVVITFLGHEFKGRFIDAWKNLLAWCRTYWLRLTAYLIAIPLPALIITFLYSRYIPTYTLSPDLNSQTSIFTILESLMIVIIGGDMEYLTTKFPLDPVGSLLITMPIIIGLFIALISLVYRNGWFKNIDLRLSLFLLGNLPVYAALKPIAYFPRYSWSFLPPSLIIIALALQFSFFRDDKAVQENQ